MSTTLIVVASATPASVLGALAMLLPALRAREVARTERAYADKTFAAAESLADEVERTRNLPWYWPTGPAIEAAPAEHEAEVLHVDFPTSELRLADGLARLADEVGLVQALGCCTAHGDEPCAQDSGLVPPYCCDDCPDRTPALSDRPAADEDEVGDEQPGATLMRPVLTVARWVGYALALVDTVVEWVRQWAIGVKHDLRERFKSNAQREAEDRVEAEFWARVNQPALTAEPVEAEADEDRWAEDSAITDGPDTAEPVTIVRVNRRYRDPGMTGQFPYVKVAGAARHAAPEPEMPAINATVPAQRDGGEN